VGVWPDRCFKYLELNLVKTRSVIFSAVLTTLLVVGCTTTPKVSSNVTAILNDMSELQAAQELQRLLPPRNLNGNHTRTFITGHIGLGLCRANQFSLDEERWLDLQVTTEEISFYAVRMGTAVSTPQGTIPSATGLTSVHRSDRIPYREHLLFDKIESVTVLETRLLRTVCGRQNGQSEVIVRETTGRWYAALIPTEEKDRFVASIMRLRPGIAVTTETKDRI
jgi:hypothetical protein